MPHSLYHRIRRRFGWRWVDPNKVLVVRRLGSGLHFRDAGEVFINPLFEDVLGEIHVGFRFVDVDVQLQSKDGHAITYTMRTGFVYDPRKAQPGQEQQQLAMKVVETPDLFAHMMDLMVGGALREHAASQLGRDLINGQYATRCVRGIEQQLYNRLLSMGVRLSLPLAIQLRTVRAPHSLREATELDGYVSTVAKRHRVAPDRLISFLMSLKLFEQLATGRGVYVLPSGAGGDLLSIQQLQQLANGVTATHRGSTPGRPQP